MVSQKVLPPPLLFLLFGLLDPLRLFERVEVQFPHLFSLFGLFQLVLDLRGLVRLLFVLVAGLGPGFGLFGLVTVVSVRFCRHRLVARAVVAVMKVEDFPFSLYHACLVLIRICFSFFEAVLNCTLRLYHLDLFKI